MSNANELAWDRDPAISNSLRATIRTATERLTMAHSVLQAFIAAANSQEASSGARPLYHPHLYEALAVLLPDGNALDEAMTEGVNALDGQLDLAESMLISGPAQGQAATRIAALSAAPNDKHSRRETLVPAGKSGRTAASLSEVTR